MGSCGEVGASSSVAGVYTRVAAVDNRGLNSVPTRSGMDPKNPQWGSREPEHQRSQSGRVDETQCPPTVGGWTGGHTKCGLYIRGVSVIPPQK